MTTPRIAAPAAIVTLAALSLAGWLAFLATQPPAPEPADTPAEGFSAQRAMRHVGRLAARPRPMGSQAHAEAREWIVGAFGELGLEAQVETRSVVEARGRFVDAASIQNIVARMPGRESGPAVLLMAHYDTRPTTPGAGDDASGVAALLETARALRARPVPRRDVLLLVTDGEEAGLLGARSFLTSDPWRGDVGSVINVEARGQRGPAILFEIVGDAEAPMLGAIRRSGLRTVASSLTSEIYRRLPNDTDLTPFGRAGISGVNLAFIGGMTAYHTPLDTAAALDKGSVQHLGAALLALAVELAERPLDLAESAVSEAGSTVYFDLLGGPLVVYPRVLAWLLAIVTVLLWLVAVRLTKRGPERGIGLGRAFAGVAVVLVGVPSVMHVGWSLVRLLVPDLARGPYALPYDSGPILIGLLLVTVGIVGWLLSRFGLAREPATALAAALVPWLILTVATTFTMPGASFLTAWPALASTLGLLWFAMRGGRSTLPLALGAVPGVLLVSPVLALIADALTINATLPLGLIAALLVLLVLPHVAALGRWALVAGLAGILALGVVAVRDRPSAARPAADSLAYRLDTDTGTAEWFAFGQRLTPWRQSLMGPDTARRAVGFPLRSPRPGFVSAAPMLAMPAPRLAVIADEPGFLRLRLSSPRGAPAAWLEVVSKQTPADVDNGIEAVWIGSERIILEGDRREAVKLWITGLPEIGIPIAFERTGRLEIAVADQRYDFLDLGDAAPEPPESRVATASWLTDSTFVVKRFAFAHESSDTADGEAVPQ